MSQESIGVHSEPLEPRSWISRLVPHFIAIFIGHTPNLGLLMGKIEGTIAWVYGGLRDNPHEVLSM